MSGACASNLVLVTHACADMKSGAWRRPAVLGSRGQARCGKHMPTPAHKQAPMGVRVWLGGARAHPPTRVGHESPARLRPRRPDTRHWQPPPACSLRTPLAPAILSIAAHGVGLPDGIIFANDGSSRVAPSAQQELHHGIRTPRKGSFWNLDLPKNPFS